MIKKGAKNLEGVVLIIYEFVLGRNDVWHFIDLTELKKNYKSDT